MAPPGHVDMQHTALSSTSCSHMPVIARAPADTLPINIGHLGLDSRLASCPHHSSLHMFSTAFGSGYDSSRFTYCLDLMKLHFCEHLLHIYLAFFHSTGAWEGLGSIFLSCYRYDFALLCMLFACMIPQVTSYSAVLAVVSFLSFGSILLLKP